MNYEEIMTIVLNEAKKGFIEGNLPYAAALVEDGKIVSLAHNEVLKRKNGLYHAEIVAIENYLKDRSTHSSNLTLVTTCEPCPKCFGASIKLGVKKFVYGSSIETAIYYDSGDINISIKDFKPHYDFEIISGVMQKECDLLLENAYFYKSVVNYKTGTKEEIKWMRRALEVAKQGMLEKEELPIGVLLVAGDEILTETSTLTYTKNSPITHGDFMALYYAEREVYSPNCKRPLVLYSTLEPHLLGFASAMKCGVDKVVFGLEAVPDGGSCYLPSMVGVKERIPKVVGGVLRKEQYELMKEFLRTHEENRVGYSYAKKLVKIYESEE